MNNYLQMFFNIPYTLLMFNSKFPDKKNHIIDAEYFPKWMYCNKCNSIKHINDWYKGWKIALACQTGMF